MKPSLSRLFKKARVSMLLVTGLLTGSIAQSQTKTSDTTQQSQPKIESVITLKLFGQENLLTNNKRITNAAYERASDIVKNHSSNLYSTYLDSLERVINNTIKQRRANDTHKKAFDRIHVLDQNKLDVARALGCRLGEGLAYVIVQEEGVLKSGIPPFRTLFNGLCYPYEAEIAGVFELTTMPLFVPDRPTDHSEHHGYLIPIMPYAKPLVIDDFFGLTQKQKMVYINTHEMGHALDTVFARKDVPIYTTKDSIEWKDLEIHDDFSLLQTRVGRRVFSAYTLREHYADVYAMGERIRAGEDIALIDALKDRRKRHYYDLHHMSPYVLDRLRKEIKKMGLDNFRNLPNDDALRLYVHIIEKHGMDKKSVKKSFEFYKSNGVQRNIRWVETLFNREAKKGWAFYKNIRYTTPSKIDSVTYSLPIKERRLARIKARRAEFEKKSMPSATMKADTLWIMSQIKGYNPAHELLSKTYQQSDKVLPETVIKAYISLQNDLLEKWLDDKTNYRDGRVIEEKLTLLRHYFIWNLTKLDYVSLNKAIGVGLSDILPPIKIEPVLKLNPTTPWRSAL